MEPIISKDFKKKVGPITSEWVPVTTTLDGGASYFINKETKEIRNVVT